jgi:hypothetical protein
MCPSRASTFSLRLRHAVVLVRARLAGVGGDDVHPLTVCSGQRLAGGWMMTVQTVPPVTQPQCLGALGIFPTLRTVVARACAACPAGSAPRAHGDSVVESVTAAEELGHIEYRLGRYALALWEPQPAGVMIACQDSVRGESHWYSIRLWLPGAAYAERRTHRPLIAGGCDVKAVQAAMRHGTASMTLDVYVGLWPDADDRARSAASAALAKRLDATADGLGTATSQAVR